jgi:Ferric reductase NAD binding domain/FAD-binding domain
MLVLSSIPSARFARKHSYEFFLIGHILCTAICLISCYMHTALVSASVWLNIAVLAWISEILVRILKTKRSGFLKLKPSFGTLTSFGTVMRLDVFAPPHISVSPGDFVYIRFPSVRFLENHPFSVIKGVRSKVKRYHYALSTTENERSPILQYSTGDWYGSHFDAGSSLPKEYTKLSFIIRPYAGLTKALHQLVKNTDQLQPIPISTYIEGPYKQSHRVDRYSHLYFMAGGVGISFTFPYLLEAQEHQQRLSGSTAASIRFVWIIKTFDELESIQDLLETLDPRMDNCIQVWLTSKMTQSHEARDGPQSRASLRWYSRLSYGRPSLQTLLYSGLLDSGPNSRSAVFGKQAFLSRNCFHFSF